MKKMDSTGNRIEILYEDEWLCVIEKPAGMLSCPYPGSRAKTAQDALEQIMRRRGTLSPSRKPLVVHRLDRATSGVMMFALNEKAEKAIMDGWHKIVTERLYHAVAENPRDPSKILPDSGLIDDALAFNAHNVGYVPKNGNSASEEKIRTVAARTRFRVVERGKTHTLFELSLDTGKKNQIRAHLAARGYPLAGDESHRARTDPFGRLALHARTLEFVHPFTGKTLSFQIPEPKEWLEFVKNGGLPKKSAKTAKTEQKNPQRRITAKERAHADFIALGKKRNA